MYSDLQDAIDAHAQRMLEQRKRAIQFFDEITRICIDTHGVPSEEMGWQKPSEGETGELTPPKDAIEQIGPQCWHARAVINIIGHGETPHQYTAAIGMSVAFGGQSGASLRITEEDTFDLNELPGSNRHSLSQAAAALLKQANAMLNQVSLQH
jgi:hypothetical protein